MATPLDRARQIAVPIAALAQPLVGLLPQLGFGQEVGARSDAVPSLVTPAGYAFAIWGPIFLASFIYAADQLRPGRADQALQRGIGWWAAAAFALNAIWIVVAQADGLQAPTLAVILLILAVAAVGCRRTLMAPAGGGRTAAVIALTPLAGWLTVAAVVNAAAVLPPDPAAPEVAAVYLALAVGAVLAGVVLTRGALLYAAPAAWGLAAVGVANRQDGEAALSLAAFAAAAVVIAAALLLKLRRPDRAFRPS
ncbi:MAG TPA: hypothetical protein VD929_09825 [Caulobacteraceae bacterium]|nr:hypothetical protein [Caulobacteraceae bacterium]